MEVVRKELMPGVTLTVWFSVLSVMWTSSGFVKLPGRFFLQEPSLNSFETICIELDQAHFAGVNYFSFPQVYDTISKEDVEACIRRWITAQRTALSIVVPGEDKK